MKTFRFLSPYVRPRPRLAASLLGLALSVGTVSAADWYLRLAQPMGNSWHTSGDWNSAANGTGSNAAAISADDTYHTVNYGLRTPAGPGPAVFGGGVLRLSGGASTLAIKTTGTAGATIPRLESLGGKIDNAEGGTVALNVTHFNNISGSTQITASTGRSVKLTAGALVGQGELRVVAASGNSSVFLALPDARRFLGQLRLSSGTLDFETNVSSSGPLVIEGGRVVLDQAVTVTSLKIGGTTLPAGTHTYDYLHNHATYGAYFPTGATGGSITVKPPGTWYLSVDQPNPEHWLKHAYWKAFPDGTGASPTEFRAVDSFDTNGKLLRAPATNVATIDDNFDGQLRITNNNTVVALKASNAGPLPRIHHLFTEGGKFNESINSIPRLRIDHWENQAMGEFGTTFSPASGVTTGGLNLSIGKLVGAGRTRFSGANSIFHLTVDDAADYTGDITHFSGTLNFDNDLRSAGRLVIGTGAKVVLDRTVAFTDVLINGVPLAVGSHSYDALHNHATHGAYFPSGTSSGEIVVREPLDWYLTQSQTNAADSWNNLLHWSSAADGTGPSPASINLIDNYVNQASNRTVRAPNGTSTFGGGALVLKGGAKLMVQTASSGTTTIPTLDVAGNATIYNGVVGVQQNLAVDRWVATSGIATLGTNTGGGTGSFNLAVKDLVGSGQIAIGSGSHVRVSLDHGNHYTGTITVGGTFTVQSQFGIGGALVVNTGGKVVLNDWAYVGGLTVNGLGKSNGIYSAADFTGWSGTGKIVVYTRDVSGPPQMFGVNLAGAEFSTEPNGFPQINPDVWQYYKNKGLTLIRLPVRWDRIQSSLNGPVNFTVMNQCIALAKARGMKVIIDLHNYAAYHRVENPPRLGSTQLPISALVNVWSQIAAEYHDEPTVYGYDLMNEPTGITLEVWADAAQQTMNAIRRADTNRYVLVEGLAYSSADIWPSTSGALDIKDPVGRLVYSAHSYWDYKRNPWANPPYEGNDGNYHSTDVPTDDIGIKDVTPFVEWLKTRPYAYGNVGEYCIPSNYYREGWETALARFLQHLRDNNISGTYWAGGNNWEPSVTVCNPQPTISSGDKTQMAVLQLYNN